MYFFFKKIESKYNKGYNKKGGRNFQGRVCVLHRGGATKRMRREVDYFRKIEEYGLVLRVIKDTYRSAHVGLIIYINGLLSYILLSEGVVAGSWIYSGSKRQGKVSKGYSNTLRSFALLSILNTIEAFPFKGGSFVRSAGVGAILFKKTENRGFLKMPSGWQISVSLDCMGSLGWVSNPLHFKTIGEKAGWRRSLGFRSIVRGVAKNPCDHPHGGGEGKKSPPAGQRSPWGWLTKGTPSKNKKKDRKERRLFKNL